MLHRLSDDSSLSITHSSCRRRPNGKKFNREEQYQWGVWERLSKLFLCLGFSPMNTSSLQACLSIRGGGMLMRPFLSQHGFVASLRRSSESLFCESRHNFRTQIESGFCFFCIMLHRLSDDSSLSITHCSCRQGSNGNKFTEKSSISGVSGKDFPSDLCVLVFPHEYFKSSSMSQHPRRRYANAAIFVATRLRRVSPPFIRVASL